MGMRLAQPLLGLLYLGPKSSPSKGPPWAVQVMTPLVVSTNGCVLTKIYMPIFNNFCDS